MSVSKRCVCAHGGIVIRQAKSKGTAVSMPRTEWLDVSNGKTSSVSGGCMKQTTHGKAESEAEYCRHRHHQTHGMVCV